jgi:heme exporter protein A
MTLPGRLQACLLSGRRLAVRRGGRPVLRAVDVELDPGGLLQVTGSNGSGKTTLLRVLAGLMVPEEGSVQWDGRAVKGGDPDYQRHLAYIGHTDGVCGELDARENLLLAHSLAAVPADATAIAHALDRFGLAGLGGMHARRMSQGQRRRLALARLALVPRRLWLLDEPLPFLDSQATDCFRAALEDHLLHGGMAVVATHQPLAVAGTVLDLDRQA